ncbi:CTP synthase [Burkholderia multivorans]|uniref:glutamine amidotransferase-related protein n=1 Tax=Burkholderia multivorans TaxID=87883 RepID=UPI000D0060F3|nr:gamma-glutamyl-gamma-aminobutyrate hydrolase family protein [Burkholderia multivorans]MBU9366040.1 gamma-glutamyl-gamma-aminobutyrate hydrolase family protein [Burkholderia multivorans]PRG77664.1 CTP synthase [Burkholderia multivorans]
MLYFVEDAAREPARFGALAALFADLSGAGLMHGEASFDERRFPDACQHVTTDGRLVASGLVFRARAGRRDSVWLNDAALDCATTPDVVIAIATGDGSTGELGARRGLPARVLRVVSEGACARILDSERVVLEARRDRYGRWAASDRRARDDFPRGPRIALIGRESDQREQYPATLAALGDAADALGFAPDVRFIAAQDIDDTNAASLLSGAHGILLPGGADMSRVSGQIAAARFGWLASIPVAGLCLGMQSMATAIARLALKSDDIGLMEAQPDARIASFMPIGTDADGVLLHRLGEQPVFSVAGSRIESLIGARATIRCNHRYRLNPELEAPLAGLGVSVTACDESGTIADAIEAESHPFFVGMQGHPELSSRDGEPHPAMSAFLEAAARR